jgi:hypothetical protein
MTSRKRKGRCARSWRGPARARLVPGGLARYDPPALASLDDFLGLQIRVRTIVSALALRIDGGERTQEIPEPPVPDGAGVA